MVKNTIAAIMACLYVAVSAWLVSVAGAAHRSALRHARSAIPSVPGSPGVSVETRKVDDRVEEKLGPPAPPPDAEKARNVTAQATAPAQPLPPAKAAEEHAASGLTASEAAKPRQEPRNPENLAMLKPAGAAAGVPRPGALDPVWNLPQVTRKWKDLSHLSSKDEMRLGADLHGLIMHFSPSVQSGPWLERVETAAKPILANRSRKDIEYTFTVLDSDAVNAFSHPGGYIYVSRGLFPFLGEDEDAALKFILAHEIAHIDLRHAIQCLQDPDLQQMNMGTLQVVYSLILPLGYMDKQEYAADRWAYQQLRRLDCTRYEALKFLRKLKGYAAEHGFSDGRAPYIPGRDSSPVENHLRAHTAVWRRLNELEASTDPVSTTPK
jgi:hypothetical protein